MEVGAERPGLSVLYGMSWLHEVGCVVDRARCGAPLVVSLLK